MAEPMPPEEIGDTLAAELALGVLEGEARAEALRRQLADRAFAADVARWREHFGALAVEIPGVEPSAGLWNAIDARLNVQGARAVRMWRRAAITASAVAAGLALVLVLRPTAPPMSPLMQPVAVARLSGLPGAELAARYDPAGGVLRIRAEAMPDSPKAPELWVIPQGGTPRSLGLVAAHGNSDLDIPADARALLVDGATLAITMEDATGAPHAGPSGPPVAAGKISLL
ncbi:anti-sigma factor domain-containing protein [Sphingomonas sp. CJ20]